MSGAVEIRGEAAVHVGGVAIVLRPTFAALCAAEAELGPLFALVERAAAGGLTLSEMTGLMWHCRWAAPGGLARSTFEEALVEEGLANATPALRVLLGQVLGGR